MPDLLQKRVWEYAARWRSCIFLYPLYLAESGSLTVDQETDLLDEKFALNPNLALKFERVEDTWRHE